MNRLLQLQQDRAALIDAAGVIAKGPAAENRAWTPEERATFDAKEAAAKEITATLEYEQRASTLANIHTDSPTQRGARIDVHDNTLDKPFSNFGEQLFAIRDAALRPDRADGRLYEIQRRTPSGASEQVPADGGFTVVADFSNDIFTISHDTGLVFTKTAKYPMSENTNSIKIPGVDEQSRVDGSRWGGVRMYWANEADAFTGSKPKVRLIELVLKKLTGLYYATDELMQDSATFGRIVMQAFGEEVGFKLDDGCIRGTGSGQLLGLLNSPALITVSKETGQASATVQWENIKKMWTRCWPRSRPYANWYINCDVEQQLMGMSQAVGTAGVPVYLPAGGASGSPYGTLMGRPVIPIEQCATVGTIGDIILADPSQIAFTDKGGLQQASSMHVKFLTDEMTFRWIYRCDAAPLWHTALTPAQGSNTLSPFVVLQGR